MRKLIESDFYRIITSKLTYVLLGIVIVFAFLTNILDLILKSLISGELNDVFSPTVFTGRYTFSTSFSMSGNICLAIPIFGSVMICNDVSSGTLRNKIISGNDRKKIFFSHFLVTSIFNITNIVIYALLNLLFGSIILGYGTKFDSNQLIYVVQVLVTGILTFFFLSVISTILSLLLCNTPATIVLELLIFIVLTMICQLPLFLVNANIPTIVKDGFNFIPTYAMNNASSLEGNMMSNKLFIGGIVSSIVFTVILLIVGSVLFDNKEIK